MGIIYAIGDATSGVLADQWKEVITAPTFTEHLVVAPGLLRSSNRGRGSNFYASDGVITNGSKILVPENTAAFVFSQAGIENVILQPGGYEYRNGQSSLLNGDGFGKAIIQQVKDRVAYGGITSDWKKVAFVNLREIRGIRFGTRGPQVYNDAYYGVDLEIVAFGSFSIRVVDPVTFIRGFVPPNVMVYSFDAPAARSQILSEFMQSFVSALNSLSSSIRVSQIPAHASKISERIAADTFNAGTWPSRFGFVLTKVAVENIEFTQASRELVHQFASSKMSMKAYDDVAKRASDIAAQQKIAEGIRANGLGDGGGMVFGVNLAQGLGQDGNTASEAKGALSIDDQIETLKKLKDLLDAGILSQEEFDAKKREIMGL